MTALIETAVGTMADLGHVRVLTKDQSVREPINPPWLEHFPEPEDRPASFGRRFRTSG